MFSNPQTEEQSMLNAPAAPVVNKRKRKKQTDGAYHPGQDRKGSSNNPQAVNNFVADTRTEVPRSDDRTHSTPKRTSVLLNKETLVLNTPESRTFSADIAESAAAIGTHKPIKAITRWSDDDGMPTEAITFSDKKLIRTHDVGPIHFFSNRSPAVPLARSAFNRDSAASSSIIQRNTQSTKSIRVLITADSLKKADAEYKANNYKRSCSQHKVMVQKGVSEKQGSATSYAASVGLSSEEQVWQWLHLVAYNLIGKVAQDEGNLGCGTEQANAQMLSVELNLRDISAAYPKGFYLDVSASFMPDSQIMEKVNYTIQTDDYKSHFVFDARSTKKPDISDVSYVRIMQEALQKIFQDKAVKAKKLSFPKKPEPAGVVLFNPVKMNDAAEVSCSSDTPAIRPGASLY
jgi:hypothetical protein